MPNKPTTLPTLDTNQTNRTIPAPSKVTDGYLLNDLLPAANANYLWGWTGDWLTWMDTTFGDGLVDADDILLNRSVGVTNSSGYTALARTMAGVELSAGSMDATGKFTAGLKFMSWDSAFTTENPKLLGAIVGRATENYGSDLDGGMAIDFYTTPNNPGATSLPLLALSLLETGDANFSHDVRLLGSDATLRLQAGTAGATGALKWTFNTADTSYGLIDLSYDDRATVGLQVWSEYPITYDAKLGHRWLINGSSEYMYMDTAGRVGIGAGFTAPTHALHVWTTDGVFIQDPNTTGNAPVVRVQGKRSDANQSQSFAGRLVVEHYRTSAAMDATYKGVLGSVIFGANHTDGSEANIAYPASIAAIAEGTFSNVSTMPTGLSFRTGSLGRASPDVANQDYGTEAMRIDASGFVGIGTSDPEVMLHVQESNVRAIGANVLAAIERDGNCFFQILSGKTSPNDWGGIAFGDADDTDVGLIRYSHAANRMELWANAVGRIAILDNGRVGIGGSFITPDTLLHVWAGNSGIGPVASTVATLENNGDAYLSILTPSASVGGLVCGDAGSNVAGQMLYRHSDTLPGWAMYVQSLLTMKVDSGRRMWLGYAEDFPNEFTGATVPADAQILNLASDSSGGGDVGMALWGAIDSWTIVSDGSNGELRFTVLAGTNYTHLWLGYGGTTGYVCIGDPALGTGNYVAIGKAPTADGILQLEMGGNDLHFMGASSTGTPSTAAGWIRVKIGGATRWIQTYSTTP